MSNLNGTLVKYTRGDGTKGSIQFDHVLYLSARADLKIVEQAAADIAASDDDNVGFEITDIKPTRLQHYAGHVSSL